MRLFVLTVSSVLVALPALADPQPTVDVASGSWGAIHIIDDLRTTTCVAASIDQKLLFRADSDDIEIRSIDPKWSLSTDTTGDLTIAVGSVQKTFPMHTMSSQMLGAEVKAEDLKPILDAMDKAPTATIRFGTKTTKEVSLSGSTKAINAFRACAGANGFADLGAAKGPASTPF